jgi:Fe2+ or Zn2+ uptake regulation protein
VLGMRATGQRIALARLLLRSKNRRVTTEILYDEALEVRCPVSRAAVCNALRQFERAGLLRRISLCRGRRKLGLAFGRWIGRNRQEESLRRET